MNLTLPLYLIVTRTGKPPRLPEDVTFSRHPLGGCVLAIFTTRERAEAYRQVSPSVDSQAVVEVGDPREAATVVRGYGNRFGVAYAVVDPPPRAEGVPDDAESKAVKLHAIRELTEAIGKMPGNGG
jgi:hypothetical protein